MAGRVDSASKIIHASPAAVYRAFTDPGAIEQWLPPRGMEGEVLHFDFRDGGRYRMRLTYRDHPGRGKTSDDSDEVEVRLTRAVAGERIEQEIDFVSDDPAFSGTMRMTWTFQPEGAGTLVTIRAEGVPLGIRSEDHEAGLNASLENLARFTEAGAG